MHCCAWALCATAHKENVYVLRLKLTRTALVSTYIYTIRHFDCGDEQERAANENFWKWTSIFGRTGPSGQRGPPLEVDHFERKISTLSEPFHLRLDRNFRKF